MVLLIVAVCGCRVNIYILQKELNKKKRYNTNLKTTCSYYQYSALTCENGVHEDVRLILNYKCKIFAASIYKNILHVANL